MLPRPRIERPSVAAIERVKSLLDRAIGASKVRSDRASLEAHAGDESDQSPVLPDVVVVAESADDVARALAAANEAGVPITPRAGGSGKSGGCVPIAGGVVLATAGMQSIKEISPAELVAVVEPGVVLSDLHAAAEAEGLFYPPDPNSASMCTLGGNVAENAAGPRAFKYGPTRDYALGLELATMSGARLTMGKRTVKGVTGYDVTSLVVGSEGTLGVVTEATLRLIPKPPAIFTLLALYPSVRAAGEAVSAIVARGLRPRCLELLDESTLNAVRGSGLGVDPSAGAMLILEVDGEPASCEVEAERTGSIAMDAGALDVLAAKDSAQRERLWQARRMLSVTTRAMARFKISEDVVVPRHRIADLLDEVGAITRATGVRTLTYGHAGDGNLHVNFLWDDPADIARVERALSRLFRSVVAMRGTLSGEHGIGSSKSPYLALEQSSELIALQRELKAVFDPRGLLNPHKIFATPGHKAC